MSFREDLAEDFKEEMAEAERLRTPWFLGSIIYDNRKEEIIESIEVNEYLFDLTGELLPITTHVRGSEIIKHSYTLSKSNEIDIQLV
jgi:hypothetical protein